MTFVIIKEVCVSLEKYIQDYQLEKIFPRHYFDKLQVRELVAGDTICHQ